MDYKERLERATLMAMEMLTSDRYFNMSFEDLQVKAAIKKAKEILQEIDRQIDLELANQETQEQEPKRGDVVWVRDYENGIWLEAKYSEKNDRFYYVYFKTEVQEEYPFIQMTTKNPYTDGSTRT